MPVRIFRHYLHLPILLLALAEAGAFFAAPYAAAYLRFEPEFFSRYVQAEEMWLKALLFAAVMSLCMMAMGLYSAQQRARIVGVLVRIMAAAVLATALAGLAFYLLPHLQLGRGLLAISTLLAVVAAVGVRVVFARIVGEDIFKRRIIVYGAGTRAHSIAQLRRRTDQRGFQLVGYVAAEGDPVRVPREKLIRANGSLLELAVDQRIEEIVVAMDDRRRSFPVQELLDCRLTGVEIVDLVTFLERETGKVRLDVLNPSWIIFADGFRRDPWRQSVERSFDVAVSLLLLAITWPVMLLTAMAIKLEDGWRAPVLYRQARVGLNCREFQVMKFRSMCPDAEVDGKARWATHGDERVTRVGTVIRKLRIDELPQVLNVLKGDMSFVGPRPERPEFVAELSDRIPYYRERHSVKPGITGWAQLCYPYGASERDAIEKLQYDLYYVKNHSLFFDLMILLQTAEVVLWGKGAR